MSNFPPPFNWPLIKVCPRECPKLLANWSCVFINQWFNKSLNFHLNIRSIWSRSNYDLLSTVESETPLKKNVPNISTCMNNATIKWSLFFFGFKPLDWFLNNGFLPSHNYHSIRILLSPKSSASPLFPFPGSSLINTTAVAHTAGMARHFTGRDNTVAHKGMRCNLCDHAPRERRCLW